ncbi:hypothetical protein KI688_008687 [Linnemannia hyalina]|uniref:Uncharacterized protein n=1 Tax=Linnemannia hyalina TaxID=64524 RepID=A0A9P7Y443_9FUNG|nr:hypothetical protein KI688_008687 [Linnemannia hyalina]
MVGPSMRPPRSISGSSSAAAAAAVAMAMATVANARLSGAASGNGGYNFEGPLDQDGNLIILRAIPADERNRLAAGRMEDYQSMGMFNPLWARAGLSARGPDSTGSRSMELPAASYHGHRKLHAYSSPSPTLPPTSRGIFPMGASSIYSATDPLSGYTRTQQSPPLTIATGRYVSTPTPGSHDMVSDPKRLAGFDYFNLPLTQSTASTPSVTSPSFAAHTRSFAQLSLMDDSSLSASLPPTPTQSNFDKYDDGMDPTSLYKAPVPLYPAQTSQSPHRPNGQSLPAQHKQLRTASVSPHPQGRDVRHQPFGFPDRRSSLPWDARISSHSGSLDSRGASKGSRQQPGSSITSASTVHGYKGRGRNSLPQSFLVRSNSTPAIFGLPSTPMTTLEHQKQHQQQQQQAHFNLQSWHGLRPKVEYDTSSTSTTIVERATQDLITATGHLRCTLAQQQSSEYFMENHDQLQTRGVAPFDRSFHNNAQGQVVQDIQDSTRGHLSSGLNSNSSTGVVSRQQEHQVRVQRTMLQDEPHQHPSIDAWAQPGLDCFEGSNISNKNRPYFGSTTDTEVLQTIPVPRSSGTSQDISAMLTCSYSPPETQLHRPTSHPLIFDTMVHGRNDATSQQQQQQHQQQFQSAQRQLQSSQHGQSHQHPLSLKVEDLEDDTFDTSLAMVLDDHLRLMDHLNMMPDVEVYQNQLSSAASMIRPTEQQQPQQQHQKITVSTSISTGLHHHPQQQRLQGPMSAPVISTHHQNLFGSSELYPAPASATPANSTVRSTGYSVLSGSSIPSPVPPEDPTIGGGMVMIKREFGHQPPHPQQQQQQQQQSILYFDNPAIVMSKGPQSAGSSTGCHGDSATGSGSGSEPFGYVQDTSFMHIKVEPDLDLDSQHQLQQQHHHQQQQPQPQTTSSSQYTMDRQHPFDPTPVQHQHQHRQQQQQQQQQHQFQHHHPQGVV